MAQKDNGDSIVKMHHGDLDIELNPEQVLSCYNTSNFEKSVLNKTHTWHQIIAHHRGKFQKRDILKALFDTVGDCDFFPVGYKHGELNDRFLVRQCKTAIQKLFERSLTITVQNTSVQLTVNFNIATYKFGQIYPAKAMERIVDKQLRKLETLENVSNVLNLDRFHAHEELEDIIINLSQKTAFDMLCKILSQNHDLLNRVNGIKFSNNGITQLQSMNLFVSTNFQILDFRVNNIKQVNQLKYLKNLKVSELYVGANPLTNSRGFMEQVKELLPSLLKLDGVYIKKTSTPVQQQVESQTTPYGIEIEFDGEEVQPHSCNFRKYKDSDMWHQFWVDHKGNYTKVEIIDSFFETLPSALSEFYPCYYTIGSTMDTFFVRNCFEQLEYLARVGLVLKAAGSDNESIRLRLKINVANFKSEHIDPLELLATTAHRKYNPGERLLNLEEFCSSQYLKDLTMSLRNSKILTSLLKCSQRYGKNLVEIRLGNNDIVDGKGFQPLKCLTNLKVLDLSNNKIENVKDLDDFPRLSIQKLRLDGNPLCRKFAVASDYIKEVSKIFLELTELDGVVLTSGGSTAMQKNYLESMEHYDFAEQFITTYFKAYDSNQRGQLADMYHRNAIFSVSLQYDPDKISDHIAPRIKVYSSLSRNIYKFSNYNRLLSSLYIGRENVKTALNALPRSEHDMFNFATDTRTLNSGKTIVITVTGIFKEPAESILENDLLFSFCRTFVLYPNAAELGFFKSTTEYQILNETFTINNPTQQQMRNAFRYEKPIKNYSIEVSAPEDKECFLVMLQQMTGLKSVWCTRCLEDGKWNFKQAVQVFLDLLNKNKIPPTAFMEGHQIN